MTLDEIKESIEEIRAIYHDDEAAHSYEDDLRAAFIAYVADSELGEISDMARLVLSTDAIAFSRWCA